MEKTKNINKSQKNISLGTQNKFKPLKIQTNELQSKYDIYKHGSPNLYEQDIDALKLHHIKNDLSTMQLPAIDYVLKEIKNTPKEIGANKRDYTIHPSMAQKYANKFKEYSSDRQQIKDFLDWFRAKDQQITAKEIPANRKFQLFQSLLASAFNQILNQICIISRPRAEVLKMLWNRQISQAEAIINIVHKSGTQIEKRNLETIKSLHVDYQEQIINLKSENYCMQKKVEELSVFNEGCINTLRVMRKQKKKLNYILKQLQEANLSLKEESLNLIEENTNLLMKDKNISPQHARILTYHIMQGRNYRAKIKEYPKAKQIIKEIKNKAEESVESYDLPDMEDRKQRLMSFILGKIKENPQQKLFLLKGQLEDEQDDILSLTNKMEEYFNYKEVQDEIGIKVPLKAPSYFKDKGVNTDQQIQNKKKQSEESQQQVLSHTDKEIQTEMQCQGNYPLNLMRVSQFDEESDLKKIEESFAKKRNSLMLAKMVRGFEYNQNDTASKIRKYSRFNENQNILDTSQRQEPSRVHYRHSMDALETIRFSHLFEHQNMIGAETPSHMIDNIKKNHKNSFLLRKSKDFNDIIKQIFVLKEKELKEKNETMMIKVESEDLQARKNRQLMERRTAPIHTSTFIQKRNTIEQFRSMIVKFVKKNQNMNRGVSKNPEKHLKKILTNVFKSVFLSGKYNFLGELINVAKNCYGKLAYEDRLLHFVYILLQTRDDNSLLSAVGLLLRIKGYQSSYEEVNNEEVAQIYFRIYFNLSLKNPNENKFNLWNNYTNLNRISSPSFQNLLKEYLSQNKCAYLAIKIRQFIGIPASLDLHEQTKMDGSYYVQINSLMMYLLEIYLIEKKNYYESYCKIIDFLAKGNQMTLQSFGFLLDLLCFSEEDQSQFIKEAFKIRKKEKDQNLSKNEIKKDQIDLLSVEQKNDLVCEKDHFYRICVRHELPLFEFMKILKYDLFKELPAHIYEEYSRFHEPEMWPNLKKTLQIKLFNKKQFPGASYLVSILQRLDRGYLGQENIHPEIFNFMYQIIVLTAFSQK